MLSNRIKTFLKGSEFYRNIVTLMTGTAVAQLIPLAVTPILTRLYSPDEFGLLALYLSTVSILSVVATGNYEKAIIMPKKDRSALGIIKLSFFLSVIVSAILFFVFLIAKESIARFYDNPRIVDLLIFIPLSVFSLSIYNIINTWFNRTKHYSKLSLNRVTRSGFASFFGVGFGIANLSALGLILSEFLSQLLATILFGRSFINTNKKLLKEVRTAEILALSKEYKKFPFFTLPADLLSMASYQLPIFVFAKIFSQSVVGFYSLCVRVLDKPFVFLTNAVYEVFRQQAMEDYNNKGNCIEIYKKTFVRLAFVSVPSMTLFFVIAPYLFKIVFGSEWEEAGTYARIICIMYVFRFIASPLSFMFYVAEKQRLDFLLHVYVFVSSAFVLWISYYNDYTVVKTLSLFVTNYSIVYIFYIIKSYEFARGAN